MDFTSSPLVSSVDFTSSPLVSSVISGYPLGFINENGEFVLNNHMSVTVRYHEDSKGKRIVGKNTLETSGEDVKNTLETSGEDAKLHSKRVGNPRFSTRSFFKIFPGLLIKRAVFNK